MNRRNIITFLTLMALFLSVNTARASNFADTYGFSAQGIAMGNAMCAIVNDWSSVYYNISGLGKTRHRKGLTEAAKPKLVHKYKTLLTGKSTASKKDPEKKSEEFYPNQIAISYFHTQPMLSLDINRTRDASHGYEPLETNAAKDLGYGVMIIGVAFDLNKIYKMPEFISSARFGLGLGSLANGYAQRVNDIDMKTHDFLRYGRETQRAVILAGIGLGFLDDSFGFGVGGNIQFRGQGSTLLTNVEVGPSEQTPQAQSKMDLKTVPAVVAGAYFSPGRFFKGIDFLKGLDLGLTYRQETYMEIYPFQTSTQMTIGGMEMGMNMAIFDFYTPHIFSAGAAYTFWYLTISAELQYEMWSKYKVSKTTQIIYEEALRTKGEDYRLPVYKDILVPKLGISYEALDWLTLMAGYYYQPSFIPPSETKGVINVLDNDKHVGSLGARFSIPRSGGMGGPVDITIAGQGQYCVSRTVTKNNPTTYNPNYSYGGWVPSGIIEVTMRL